MTEQETKPRIVLNPPPSDGCCEVCGKHKDELKYFTKETFPYNPKYFKENSAKLIKNFRGFPPSEPNPWISKSWECRDCIVLDKKEAWEKFKKRNGEEYYTLPISELRDPSTLMKELEKNNAD